MMLSSSSLFDDYEDVVVEEMKAMGAIVSSL